MIGMWIISISIAAFIVLLILGIIQNKDCDDGTGAIAVGIGILIVGLILGAIFIDGEYLPLAAQDANVQCHQQGFDTYESYERKPFGSEAFGVRCKNINNKKQIDTNADMVIVSG